MANIHSWIAWLNFLWWWPPSFRNSWKYFFSTHLLSVLEWKCASENFSNERHTRIGVVLFTLCGNVSSRLIYDVFPRYKNPISPLLSAAVDQVLFSFSAARYLSSRMRIFNRMVDVKKMKQLCSDFLKQSSMHGLKYIAQPNKSWTEK